MFSKTLNKSLFLILLLGLITIYGAIFIFPLPAFSAIYYVSVDGNDADPGTQEQPFRTIQKAANIVGPGDVVIVRPGFYNERVDTLRKSGQPGRPITFVAEPQGQATMLGFHLGYSPGSDYIRIEGFKIVDSGKGVAGILGDYSTGIEVINNSFEEVKNTAVQIGSIGKSPDYVRIIGNKVRGCSKGFSVGGNGVIVENNIVIDLKYWGTVEVDYMRFFGTNGIIRNNRFYGINLSPDNIGTSHVDCFQTWGNTSNYVIENNLCADSHQGVFARTGDGRFSGTRVTNITIRNNLFVRIGKPITSKNEDRTVQGAEWDLKAYNNTIYGGMHGISCEIDSKCDIKNNIFFNVDYPYLGGGVMTVGHNLLFHQNKSFKTWAGQGNIVDKDPLFVALPSSTPLGDLGDLHIKDGSPAIDAGIALSGFSYDIDGISRPQSSAWDIGAYEFFTEKRPASPKNLRIIGQQ